MTLEDDHPLITALYGGDPVVVILGTQEDKQLGHRIRDRFFEKYGDYHALQYRGHPSLFDDFVDEIDELIEQPHLFTGFL